VPFSDDTAPTFVVLLLRARLIERACTGGFRDDQLTVERSSETALVCEVAAGPNEHKKKKR
jgi:hypothetical protein